MLKYILLASCILLTARTSLSSSKKKDQADPWKWQWFPNKPGIHSKAAPHKQTVTECDDGVHSIDIDFDPSDKRHSFNYLCLAANRTVYTPDLNREAVLVEHYISPAYVPPIKCLNVSLNYADVLPTFGAHRPLPPKYGTYQYLPPQRWLHSLADGAIVMLYHPCASPAQVKTLQNTLKGCLYRHIITPSQALSPERPLALLAWGRCLQMSVVDNHAVVDFIKQNAKHGLKSVKHLRKKVIKSYEAGLLLEAHLVTDELDTEICGYKEM